MKLLFKQNLFLWHYFFAIIYAFIMFYIMKITHYSPTSYNYAKTFSFYLLAIIGAPILETVIAQLIPFKILQLLKIKNYYINLILLTAFFLIIHNKFNDNLMIISLFAISCSIPVNYFLMTQKSKGLKIAVLRTMILHAAYNLTILLLSLSAIF